LEVALLLFVALLQLSRTSHWPWGVPLVDDDKRLVGELVDDV